MSLSVRPSSVAVVIATLIGLAACVDPPQLSVGTASGDAAGRDAGAVVSRAGEGMVLVPEVTLDSAGISPTGADPVPQAKGDKEPKPPKDDKEGKADAGTTSSSGGTSTSSSSSGGTSTSSSSSGGTSGTGTSSGTDPGAPPAPATSVVPAFWIDVSEVTVASYRACIAAGTCDAPSPAPGCTLGDGLEEHPVTCVTVEQARVFCTWKNKRLVRGDEFTAAAGGNARRTYPWGAEAPSADRLNACGGECTPAGMYTAPDGYPRTAPVRSFSAGASPEGAFDLAGNVAEWVEGSLVPVARGGSYEDVDVTAVSASALRINALAGPAIGFRCAADTQQP